MLEHYLRLLDSLKEHKISDIIFVIAERIMRMTESNYASNRLKIYFPAKKPSSMLLFMPQAALQNIPADVESAFIITDDKQTYYFNKTPFVHLGAAEPIFERLTPTPKEIMHLQAVLQQACLLPKSPTESLDNPANTSGLTVKLLTPGQQYAIASVVAPQYIEPEPFSEVDYQNEPNQVIQIKIVLNALYHLQLAISDLENINLRDKNRLLQDMQVLYNKTITHAYQACHLLTHLSIDFAELFNNEISVLLNLLSRFAEYTEEHKKSTGEIANLIREYPLSHHIGKVAGIAIKQMQPDQETDYQFLTQFSAVLPSYLQQLATIIKQYSSEIIEQEPTLNREKIEALQNAAIKLLYSIDSVQNSATILSFKALHYLRIIRHIITLSTSIFEQMGYLSDTSQDTVRDLLAQLKYEGIAPLFALFDKVKSEFLIAPATYDQELTNIVSSFYQQLVYYVQKSVDFSVKGQELLVIDEPKFIGKRLEDTRERFIDIQQSLVKMKHTKQACLSFFKIIKKYANRNSTINALSTPTKQLLTKHYQQLHAYFEQIDLNIANQIVLDLSRAPNNNSLGQNLWNWVTGYSQTEIGELLAPSMTTAWLPLQRSVLSLIDSKLATLTLRATLNEDIIHYVCAKAPTKLYPHKALIELKFNEAHFLQLASESNDTLILQEQIFDTIITNPASLTDKQAFDLHKYYHQQHKNLITNKDNFNLFMTSLMAANDTMVLNEYPEEDKKILRILYQDFQARFINFFSNRPDLIEDVAAFDNAIINALQATTSLTQLPIMVRDLLSKRLVFENDLIARIRDSLARKNHYHQVALAKYVHTMQTKTLTIKPVDRVDHVLKHIHLSNTVRTFRTSLLDLIHTMFDPQLAQELIPATENGLPFPELGDKDHKNKTLAHSRQSVTIKRAFNALYHLEGIFNQLEQLTNTSFQLTYVRHLVKAYSYYDEIVDLLQECYLDPYFFTIAKELVPTIVTLRQILMAQSAPYLEDSSVITITTPVKYEAIWSGLLAFSLIPDHITALSNHTYLTPTQLTDIQTNTKKMVVDIERILSKSNSYFSLATEVKTMYSLFKKLSKKLHLFTSSAYQATVTHLDDLRALLTTIVITADSLEHTLCLKFNGSDELKKILDKFYEALISQLNFPSTIYFNYVTSLDSFDQRLDASQKRAATASAAKVENQQKYNELTAFLTKLQQDSSYSIKLLAKLAAGSKPAIGIENRIIMDYQIIHPLIIAQKVHWQVLPPSIENSLTLNQVINNHFKKPGQEEIVNVMAAIKISADYYAGQVKTHQLAEKLAAAKDQHLQHTKVLQVARNEQFKATYSEQLFSAQLTLIINQSDCFLHVKEDYNKQLKAHLNAQKHIILATACLTNDIEKSIHEALIGKAQEFKIIHHHTYAQLDNVRSAIEAFNLYIDNESQKITVNNTNKYFLFNQGSLFEDIGTLKVKKDALSNFKKLAIDESKPACERLANMRGMVNSSSFRMHMLGHSGFNTVNFKLLKRLFAGLLQSLGLKLPEDVKLFNKIEYVIAVPIAQNSAQKPGFFAKFRTRQGAAELVDPTLAPTPAA